MAAKNVIFLFFHFIVIWCYKCEQNWYSRSKATAEIRFAQKQDGHQITFFVLSFYNELVYQI